MKYFTDCQTQEELKKEYRRLCKMLHPDNGGDINEFKKMQADFETAASGPAWNTFTNKDNKTYQKETVETPAEFMEVIEFLSGLKNIEIELCGTWLWITGKTYDCRNELKKVGARYSRNKNAWYIHHDKYRKKSKKKMTLDDIRAMYGSTAVKNKVENEKLTAAV